MRKPTQDLADEHGGIMLMLAIMKQVAESLQKGVSVKREHLVKIVDFLKNFADKCHHGKEEGILFPLLVRKASNQALVSELIGEHQAGRDLVRGIADSVQKFQTGNPDATHIAVNAKEYIQLLTEHIRKENTLLFPIADKELSRELQQEIIEKFENLEHEVIGEGKHEEYHSWLEELKQVYLV